jgi:rhodanese-related sulfurtransferase
MREDRRMDLAASVPSVDAATARDLVAAGALLVDCREDQEWQAGHAPEAVLLPLSRFADAPAEVPRDRQVVVVCRSGHRSLSATAFLLAQGYDAVNLAGGMQAWVTAGGPLVGAGPAPAII